jgi:hypothetical protein
MNNPAIKGRELLKAARSQAILKKPETEVKEVIKSENNQEHADNDKSNTANKQEETNVHVPEVSKVSERLAMFSTKSKLVMMNYDQNNINTQKLNDNKIKLLNRMNNKDTATIITNPKPLIDTKEKQLHHVEVDTHSHTNFEIKTGDKEKLMKKISTAKVILKSNNHANFDHSDKIMGMAALLNNKLNLGSGPIKFSSNDDDIQQIEDDKSKNTENICTKNVDEILMDKPINKNIRKKTLTKFVLEK